MCTGRPSDLFGVGRALFFMAGPISGPPPKPPAPCGAPAPRGSRGDSQGTLNDAIGTHPP